MEMNQVRYFLALCKEETFTRAAARCGVSQPSLTTAIKKLERELGGSLFDRKRGSALTELGVLVRPFLERIAWNAETAKWQADSLANAAVSGGAHMNGAPNSIALAPARNPGQDEELRQPLGQDPIELMLLEPDTCNLAAAE
jgi:DNA-binding transcriptional LysR family regulator